MAIELTQLSQGIRLDGVTDFSLADTLSCGQCFRFFPNEDGSFSGVAGQHEARILQQGDSLVFYGATYQEVQDFWSIYLDLHTDYGAIRELLCQDPTLRRAAQYAPGIRILRQDAWEALCSFILSQNNNIKRIQGIIRTLCAQFGEKLPSGGFCFPSAKRLAECTLEDLASLRCGFRAKYVLDAARRVSSLDLDLEALRTAPLDTARPELMRIHGVGPKVAECALLYGLHRMECFPVDVWISRAMKALFPKGLPQFALPYAGIAQQYLFHYVRTSCALEDSRPAAASNC